MSLELPDQSLVVEIPYSNVPITETNMLDLTNLRTIFYLQQLKQTLESGLMARA